VGLHLLKEVALLFFQSLQLVVGMVILLVVVAQGDLVVVAAAVRRINLEGQVILLLQRHLKVMTAAVLVWILQGVVEV
jgi:hypothetical protein